MTSVGRLLRLHPLLRLRSRTYHSYDHPPPPGPFNLVEHAIISASIPYVPSHGFTNTSLSLGAKDAGYPDASMSLFPRGAFSIVHYHLVTQRLRLAQHQQAMNFDSNAEHPKVDSKVKALIWARLEDNKQIIHRWQEALALMALPSNLSISLQELVLLSDDIWFLSGDRSVDSSWYTKRASISTIYAAADLFMTTDKSEGFSDTKAFLERRFEDARYLDTIVGSLGEWIGFTAGASVNVLRNKGLRI